MGSLKKFILATTALLSMNLSAQAADLYSDPPIAPPPMEPMPPAMPPMPPAMPPEVMPHGSGGWYLRGDVGYSMPSTSGVVYHMGSPARQGNFVKHDIASTWMLSGGLGYQITDYLRVDATLSHHFASAFTGSSGMNVPCKNDGTKTCNYADTGEVGATTFLLNGYLDAGNFNGFTPYVGAGIGLGEVHWGDLRNLETCAVASCAGDRIDAIHPGGGDRRLAYALHAGVSYDLSASLKLDAGYTMTHIDGGDAFHFEAGNAYEGSVQGFDKDLKYHTIRAGLRWSFW